ncbi:hypothetical protein ELH91_10275 [Rhizobium leguminosarum]|nr:hypothetical protein ELH91_10275 [Rhizobium leguminosarum]
MMEARNGFDKDEAFSVFEAMRPDHGEKIDRVAIATYSLDLVAVAAMMLSTGPAGDEELDAGPLSLIDALRDLTPRMTILHQKGRLVAAKRHHGVLHLMDGMLKAVAPERRSSWHPKALLGRYLGPGDAVTWRLWIGSRNMTGGLDREAGLLLVGRTVRLRAGLKDFSVPLLEMFRDVQWPAQVWTELQSVKWEGPPETRLRRIHWRSQGAQVQFITALPGEYSTTVVSPFVDKAGLGRLALGRNSLLKLLTTQVAGAGVAGASSARIRVVGPPSYEDAVDVSAAGESADGEAPKPTAPAGLHAKLVLKRSSMVNRLWIGSANATSRGLSGPNAEVMVELDVADTYADAIEAYWDVGQVLQDVETDPAKLELEMQERALDEALQAILTTEFKISTVGEGAILEVDRPLDDFLKLYDLSSRLFTLPEPELAWHVGSNFVQLAEKPIPLSLMTDLVCFRATAKANPQISREWAQRVIFRFDVAKRDRAAQAAYIGSKLRQWLSSQLTGIQPTESETWDGRGKGGGHPPSTSALDHLRTFTIENVLSAWAKNPNEFEARAMEMAEVLKSFELEKDSMDEDSRAQLKRDLDALMPFWAALEKCLKPGRRRGA